MHVRLTFFLLILCFSSQDLFSQSLAGTVTDRSTGQPLRQVRISVLNSSVVTQTNYQGEFLLDPLPDLPEDWVQISMEKHGYVHRTFDCHVFEDSLIQIEIRMDPKVTRLHEGVVITADRYARDAFEVPEFLTTYDIRQFRQYAPRSVPDALIGESGVWIQKNNQAGGAPYIRGLTGNQTLLVVDGIRMNYSGPAGSNSLLNTIDPYSMERLEVIRGSGSAQFGTDAMGGIVQVFSRSPDFSGEGMQVHGSGAFRYLSGGQELGGHGEVQFSTPWMALHAGYSIRDFGDLLSGKELSPQSPSAYLERATDIKARFKLGAHNELTVAHQFMRQKNVQAYEQVKYRGFQDYTHDPRERQLSYARWTSFYNNKFVERLQVTTSYQRLGESRSFQYANSADRLTEQDQINTWGGGVEVHSQPGLYWKVVSGMEYYLDQAGGEAYRSEGGIGIPTPYRARFAEGSQASNLSIYSLHAVDLLKLRLSFGGRANAFMLEVNDPAFGKQQIRPNAVVGKLAAMYPLNPNFMITSALNTGFRTPNLYDMNTYGSFGMGLVEVPSDSLSPERSLSSEIGLKAKTDHFSGSLVFYRTRLSDLIERMPGLYQGLPQFEGQDVYRKINTGRAMIQGFEAELEVPVNQQFAFYGNLVYTYGQHLSKDEPLSNMPPLNGRLGLHYRSKGGFWGRLEWLHAEAQSRLSQQDIANPLIPQGGSSAWNVLNVHIGYDFQWGYATLGLRNALNEVYRLYGSGIEAPGRVVVLSLQLGF